MQYSVAKNVIKPQRGSGSKRQNEYLISWPVQLTQKGQGGVAGQMASVQVQEWRFYMMAGGQDFRIRHATPF